MVIGIFVASCVLLFVMAILVKAAMVSNLLVVLCADEPVLPVINSCTLNH